ncbi:MAG: hypothetical protein IJ715_02185 [Bacilli bacterium]|nr:hypothetical protein [Bacilli bacterium]
MKKIGIYLQFILSILLLIVLIAGLFVKGLDLIWISIMGLLLLILSFNNHNIYKRKYATPIYLIFGIIVLVSVVVRLING